MSSFQDRFLPKIFQNQILKIKTSNHSIPKDNKVSFEKKSFLGKNIIKFAPSTLKLHNRYCHQWGLNNKTIFQGKLCCTIDCMCMVTDYGHPMKA
jgi:hypothetical protein